MQIKIFNIDYDIEFQDVYDLIEDQFTDGTTDEAARKIAEKKILEIRKSLPTSLTIEVDDNFVNEYDSYELESSYIADAISDETGWLVNDFEYETI